MDNLAPDNSVVFSNHGGVFNIHPLSEDFNYCDFTFPLYAHYQSFYDMGQHANIPPYYHVPSNATHLISVPEEYQASWRTIPSGITAAYEAHGSVTLVPGFHAEQGSNFTVRSDPCPTCEDIRQRKSMQKADNIQESKVLHSEHVICESNNLNIYVTDENTSFECYPNPTSGLLNIRHSVATKSQVSISLYNSHGILQRELYNGVKNEGVYNDRIPNFKLEVQHKVKRKCRN